MTLGGERKAVQNPLIRYATEVGWTYVGPDEALRLRRGREGTVFYDVLVAQLQRLNPGTVDGRAAGEIISRLVHVRPHIEGNLQAWEFLNGLRAVFVEAERRERNVRFLDTQSMENNAFHVTDEFSFTNGTHTIRPDVVFLINGIPILIVETKAATELEGIAKALDQIRRYHREGPELLSILQLHSLTHLVQYYYGATWNLERKGLFNWRDEQAGDFETLIKTFVEPHRILRVLTEFILFVRVDGELSKAVLRPHQMRAAERVVQRARDPKKRRGLVWHTQGSGKTYTMITVAKRLIDDPFFENPTVLMLVDRNELEAQLFGNLEAVGFGYVEVANSKAHLRNLLRSDQRGLIVSMIHKFDDIPDRINERANIFVLVDEAHRTTGGDLGNYLMGALPNATYVGFTGTPIDKTAYGKGTFKVFGTDDPKGYLDKYSIRESIEDGTTVPLHYELAPNELQPDRETMEKEFWALAELEGVSEIEELNRVLDRAVNLRNMLKNPDRIDRVAAFVAKHYRTVVAPMGYKAFLVAVDREACALYKNALDRYLDPVMSRVVISAGHNDPELLEAHHLSDAEEKEVRKAFRKPDQLPNLLIVTEKLLTGYDAPILYCMYLDKPMRDHVLLQAIARVNRPYEDEDGRRKTRGQIVDLVGVFDKLERALAFDSEDVSGVVEGIHVLKARFEALIEQGRTEFLPLAVGPSEDKKAESVLEHFRDRKERERFYGFFRELEELYEILSPDPFLRPLLEDYQAVVVMYRLLRSCYEPNVLVDRSFLRKTAQIVQQHTATDRVNEPCAGHEINAELLDRLAGDEKPDTVKVFNLIKALYQLVAEREQEEPYLIPIGERARVIAEAFEQRQVTSQQALAELEKLVAEYGAAVSERKRTDLSADGFGVYWLLQREGVDDAQKVAREAAAAFVQYPHWKESEEQERQVRTALYRALIQAGVDNLDLVSQILSVLERASP
ncbi:MAG: HsdR family type I site-specific deoxyribonuclease [Candidatus Bipolaricaulis sp.]|nr:HsdR family type I site-specific deoxyribonuclease [Candidatus Bipolaricaulis sp.]